MRLELLPSAGSSLSRPPATRWMLERGRRTIGRADDCDWRLPQDQRSISKLHCIIERKGNAFILEDRSSNGSLVDGKLLRDGATVTLRNDSQVQLGSLSFDVRISGAAAFEEPDADDSLAISNETLTISSILADIVPAGHVATGVAGPREADDPLAFSVKSRTSPLSSRNVQIGWNGPPTPETISKVIPDDWYGEADIQLAHSLEHSTATRVSVHVGSATRTEAPNLSPKDAPLPFEEDIAPDASIGGLSRETERLLHQLELALEQGAELLGVKLNSTGDDPFSQRAGAQSPTDRVASLLSKQRQMNAALEGLIHNSARTFDPTIIEARVDAAQKKHIAWLREAAYWRAYRAQFDQNGRRLSVANLLVSGSSSKRTDATGPRADDLEEGNKLNEV
ncbi:FHA domain-containing protein [Rhizobium oryzicola]|uniref:FHA domain-containing protein n=1 Tax=Rhizobium oryzicola TaxID=1232668 RepID=A0ABT8SXE6_9HYPH|nr:FHA domain-containing protein [Rhizobium oryzicola]MDO1583092.1 FHA domain-containing protein [Rhizobium oryzicola]